MGRARTVGAGVGALAAGVLVVLLLVAGALMLLGGGEDPRPAGAAPLVIDARHDPSLMSLPESVGAPGSMDVGRPPPRSPTPPTGSPEALVGDATPLTASGLLRLRVVDPQGGTVEAAELQVVGWQGVGWPDEVPDPDEPPGPLITDAAGLVVFVPRTDGVVIAHHAQVGTSRPVELETLLARRRGDEPLDLELLPPAQVEVSVVTHDGAPAWGAEVHVYVMGFWPVPAEQPVRVTTDAAGLASVPRAFHQTLVLRAGFPDQPETEWSDVGMSEARVEDTIRVTLTLPGPWRAFGTVVGWDGEPVAGAQVTTWRHLPGGDLDAGRVPPGEPWRDDATADDQGRFHVELPAPGDYQLLASGAGHAPSEVQRVTVSPSTPRAETWLTQPDAASIAGRLVDGRGQPLVGVAVQARPANHFKRPLQQYGPTVFARMGEASMVTDDDGRFSLAPLHPDGVYIVWCRPDEARRDRKLVVPDVPVGTHDLSLVADEESLARAMVEVGVTAGGRPVDGITSLLLIDLDGRVINTRQPPYPMPPGQLRYQGLAPGRSYRLRVDGPGRGAVELPWFEARAGVQHFDVALPLSGAVDVKVQDDAGRPREGATVTARPISEFPLRPVAGRAVTDAAGRALLDDLDPGPHALRVRLDGREVAHEVEVLSGVVESVTVTL